ncbi:MAG: HAD hydrolase-like protein [Acidimicrobiia bacterium]|nr:HAD hydrolase-like protein [Acidimicrobiia bacterium]
MTPDLVIFDLDGTLIDSMGTQATAFATAVEISKATSTTYAEAERVYHATAGAPLRQQFSEAISTSDLSTLDALETDFWKHVEGSTFAAFADADDCVAQLVASRVPLGISSGSSCASVEKKLHDSGLARSIPIALGSDDPNIGEKGAAHVQRILRHHFDGRSLNDVRIAFVGDTTHDVTLALTLGLDAYGIQRDEQLLKERVPGSHLLSDLRDLPPMLGV